MQAQPPTQVSSPCHSLKLVHRCVSCSPPWAYSCQTPSFTCMTHLHPSVPLNTTSCRSHNRLPPQVRELLTSMGLQLPEVPRPVVTSPLAADSTTGTAASSSRSSAPAVSEAAAAAIDPGELSCPAAMCCVAHRMSRDAVIHYMCHACLVRKQRSAMPPFAVPVIHTLLPSSPTPTPLY
jgi:hypothetical protein